MRSRRLFSLAEVSTVSMSMALRMGEEWKAFLRFRILEGLCRLQRRIDGVVCNALAADLKIEEN